MPIFWVNFDDSHPHSFALAVFTVGIFTGETKDQLDIIANLSILATSLRRRTKIIAELSEPYSVFKIVAILFERRKRIVLLTPPFVLWRFAFGCPTVGKIAQIFDGCIKF